MCACVVQVVLYEPPEVDFSCLIHPPKRESCRPDHTHLVERYQDAPDAEALLAFITCRLGSSWVHLHAPLFVLGSP